MEQSPEKGQKNEVMPTVRLIIEWAESYSNEVLRTGDRLSEQEQKLAKLVGVESPEHVRVLEVPSLPDFDVEEIKIFADKTGFNLARLHGLTLGYGIVVADGHRNERLISHELRHVHQFEQIGSLTDFIEQYVQELIAHGYRDAPMEIDARQHEVTSL